VPATGFSIGVSRLQAALTLLGKLDTKAAPGPVLVTVFDRERVVDYQKMVSAFARGKYPRRTLSRENPKHSVGQQLNTPTAAARPAPLSRFGRKDQRRGASERPHRRRGTRQAGKRPATSI